MRTPWQFVRFVGLTALPHAWALGGALVVCFAEPDSGHVPTFTALVGIVLFSRLAIEPMPHRWIWGCDYSEQTRSHAALTFLTALIPRALGVSAALVWHACHYGHVCEEAWATALMLLGLGLLTIGAKARRAWRRWMKVGPVIVDPLIVSFLPLMLAYSPVFAGPLSLSTGFWIGVAAAALGGTATAWILVGLPEAPLRHWYRRKAE